MMPKDLVWRLLRLLRGLILLRTLSRNPLVALFVVVLFDRRARRLAAGLLLALMSNPRIRRLMLRWLLRRCSSMKVPEEGRRPLLEVSKRSIRKYFKHDNMSSHAAALAYRALFALVPFLALLVALAWFLGIGDFFTQWLSDQTSSALLGQTAELVQGWIKQSQLQTQGERLSIGIVTISIAIWSVSSGVRTLTKALNVVHEVEESRPGWKRYGLSFFYALGLAIMVILATA